MYRGISEWDLKFYLQRLLKLAFLENLHNEGQIRYSNE